MFLGSQNTQNLGFGCSVLMSRLVQLTVACPYVTRLGSQGQYRQFGGQKGSQGLTDLGRGRAKALRPPHTARTPQSFPKGCLFWPARQGLVVLQAQCSALLGPMFPCFNCS